MNKQVMHVRVIRALCQLIYEQQEQIWHLISDMLDDLEVDAVCDSVTDASRTFTTSNDVKESGGSGE